MNREILFRGKRTDNGEWIEGKVWQISDELSPFIMKRNKGAYSAEVDTNTVCQYTGLVNELGEEFWENDIVQCGIYYGIIKYEDGAFVIKWDTNGAEFLRNDLAYWVNLRNIRVVGNVFDNLELLKKTKGDK